jgi:hypothetical protein
MKPVNRCRTCGATSYKPVIKRDGTAGCVRPVNTSASGAVWFSQASTNGALARLLRKLRATLKGEPLTLEW